MIGKHDRQETDEQMELGVRAIQGARVRYQRLADQLSPPAAGSMLDLERAHTAREPVDTLVMTHRARSTENLDRVFEIMIDNDNEQLLAYPFSLYSLIRTAVEAAATSMWLIKSSKKSDRVLRALQLAYRNAQEALRFAELIKGRGGAAPVRNGTEKTIERLNQLKDTVGPLRQLDLGPPPSYTAILTAVSPKSRGRTRSGYEVSSPLVVWKASSAFLHGSEQVMRALSDVRQMNEFTDGVASFEITPSIQMLAVSIRTCVELIAQLDERYEFLATHDYAGRLVSNGARE
ncbi:hypothetical protein [Microbacterium lacticum]|nr:hypothetical protein [Microbacterium lacticum]GEB96119.1 hypothetical protein MLA01_23380 [Microbacterium lacticum]GGI72086.1 hypothetical protein GCM10009724_23820 [Microbacterium lacticum]